MKMKIAAIMLVGGVLFSACGDGLRKCPAGSSRVFCGIDLYTAPKVTIMDPPPECVIRKDLAITFCVKTGTPTWDITSRLSAYIAKNWNQTLPEFSRYGGLYAIPRESPCVVAESNPWPGTSPFDIDNAGPEPGKLPATAGGSGGGMSGGAPDIPECKATVGGVDGGGNPTCGQPNETCDTGIDCCSGSCSLNACD